MNSIHRRGIQFLACLCIVSVSILDCDAQVLSSPLFVIKSPTVEKSQYAKDFNTKLTSTSFALQKPSEQDVSKSLDEELEEKDVDLLDDLANEPVQIPETVWNLKPMSSIAPRIRGVEGKAPADRSARLTSMSTVPLMQSSKVFAWAAPNINYEPLFFEDVALERYGQTRGLIRQPFASAARYLTSAALIPYTSFYDPIDSCDHPLGYARPGDCTECVKEKHFFGNPFGSRRK